MGRSRFRKCECQPCNDRCLAHFFPCFFIRWILICPIEILKYKCRCMNRQRITNRLMSLTPIPFYRMGQHINSGSCCHSRRHGIGQFRINDCCFRIKSFRYNRCLFPICMIRKNRYTGHLTSGSCGSRNRNQRQMFRRKCNPRPMVFPDRILCQSHACSSLCTIHRASASQGNHKSDIILTDNFRTGIHFCYIRIWDMPEVVRQAQKEHEESLAKQAALPADDSAEQPTDDKTEPTEK